MPSSSATELASKLLRAADAVPRSLGRGVADVALEGKRIAVAEYVAAGVNPTGSRLGRWSVGFDLKEGVNPTAELKVRGRKMHLFENPTKAHPIGPRRRRALHLTGLGLGVFRARVGNHPGTKGARVFHGRAKPRIAKKQPEIMARGFRNGLRDAGLGR